MPHIQIIVGSTRPGRLAKPIADWLFSQVDKKFDATFELVDIADYDLPLFNEPMLPAAQKYEHDYTKKWASTISKADGYVFVTSEYNHSPSGALKNAFDYLFMEWKYKPVAFVGYGAVGGVRAIEQLIGITVAANMFPLRDQLHIYEPWAAFDDKGDIKPENIKGSVKTTVEALVNVAEKTQNLR